MVEYTLSKAASSSRHCSIGPSGRRSALRACLGSRVAPPSSGILRREGSQESGEVPWEATPVNSDPNVPCATHLVSSALPSSSAAWGGGGGEGERGQVSGVGTDQRREQWWRAGRRSGAARDGRVARQGACRQPPAGGRRSATRPLRAITAKTQHHSTHAETRVQRSTDNLKALLDEPRPQPIYESSIHHPRFTRSRTRLHRAAVEPPRCAMASRQRAPSIPRQRGSRGDAARPVGSKPSRRTLAALSGTAMQAARPRTKKAAPAGVCDSSS